MNNFKISLSRNLKPYSTYIPNINKATLRSILKGSKILVKIIKFTNIYF